MYHNNTINTINNTMEINVEMWAVQILPSLKYCGVNGTSPSGSASSAGKMPHEVKNISLFPPNLHRIN